MLADAENRARIRRLAAPQLFFSLKELDEDEITSLLPHITEEQWTAVLDLDVWSKDRACMSSFFRWERHIIDAEDAVARKIVRASDLELWVLALKRSPHIAARNDEDEFESESVENQGTMQTPDNNYLITLPADTEEARLYRSLLFRLYQLDPDFARRVLEEARYRTSTEVEEEAYQNRRRRIEDLGFQDYFDAIGIYTPLDRDEQLPQKDWEGTEELSRLPTNLPSHEGGPLLLFRAFAGVREEDAMQDLVEELFFVCNKLLSADRISPGNPAQIRKTIRKALACLNLGLDYWAAGNLPQAVLGVKSHYLLSFFQIGFGRLTDIRNRAIEIERAGVSSGNPFLNDALGGLTATFPVLTEQKAGDLRTRFFESRADLQWAEKLLAEMIAAKT